MMLSAVIISVLVINYSSTAGSASAVISPARPIPTHGQAFIMTCNSTVAMASTFVWMLNASQDVCMNCTMMTTPDISSFVNSMSFRSKILETAVQVSSLNLVIDPVTASQHGGNVYDCVAINSQGNFATSVMLHVAPAFVRQPVSQEDLKVGDSATLTCVAESHPPPMYQWEQFNETSQSFVELTGETSTTLQLTNLSVSDFGLYRCRATTPEINVTIVSNTSNISNASLQLSSTIMTKLTISNIQLTTQLSSSPSTDTPRQKPDLVLLIGAPVFAVRVLAIVIVAISIAVGYLLLKRMKQKRLNKIAPFTRCK